jgi:hypothetical protein
MSDYTIGMLAWVAVLVASMPYVNRIRHPDQQPVAAYMIFLFAFLVSTAALYGVLSLLLGMLELSPLPDKIPGTISILLLVFVPAFLTARWLASKPPWRHTLPR